MGRGDKVVEEPRRTSLMSRHRRSRTSSPANSRSVPRRLVSTMMVPTMTMASNR